MDDNSKMTFGKHAGKRLEEVPSSYLLWLWDKDDGVWQQPGELHDYIKESWSALLHDNRDFVALHPPAQKRL
jgi:hypothetical protein